MALYDQFLADDETHISVLPWEAGFSRYLMGLSTDPAVNTQGITRAELETALGIATNDADLTDIIDKYNSISPVNKGNPDLNAVARNAARAHFADSLGKMIGVAENFDFRTAFNLDTRQKIADFVVALTAQLNNFDL